MTTVGWNLEQLFTVPWRIPQEVRKQVTPEHLIVPRQAPEDFQAVLLHGAWQKSNNTKSSPGQTEEQEGNYFDHKSMTRGETGGIDCEQQLCLHFAPCQKLLIRASLSDLHPLRVICSGLGPFFCSPGMLIKIANCPIHPQGGQFAQLHGTVLAVGLMHVHKNFENRHTDLRSSTACHSN